MSQDLIPCKDSGVIVSPGIPQMTFPEIEKLARCVAESRMFGIQTPAQAVALMYLCQSEGLHPMQAVRRYHLINGRPSMRADAMLAEFQRQGGRVEWGERTDKAVTGTFSHPSGGSVTVTWTVADAERAGLLGNNTWTKFPRQMLTARVVSEAIRTVLPGVVAGVYTPEEVSEFEPLPAAQPSKPLPEPNILPPAAHEEDSRGADIDEQLRADLKKAVREFAEMAVKCGHTIRTNADVKELLGSILGKPGPFTATDFREGLQQLIEAAPDGEQDAPDTQEQPAEAEAAAEQQAQQEPAEAPLFGPGEIDDPFADELEKAPYTAHETTATGRKRGK